MSQSEPYGPPEVQYLQGVHVVRDDKTLGGTKARVLPRYMNEAGFGETVVYASPAYGYAQVALAYSAAATGRQAVVFVAKRSKPHPRTVEAYRAGAKVIQVPNGYLSVVQSRAKRFVADTGATLLPFGFDTPGFREALTGVAGLIDLEPDHVWSVAGSGTLTRSLQERWPRAVFHAVQIGKKLGESAGRAEVLEASETFEQAAKYPPPFPSCDNYDAKAWFHIDASLTGSHLFWNVAA